MRIPIPSASLIVALALAGCGGAPQPATAVPASSMQEAVARAGDVTIRASVLPTAMLDERVARGYGIERSDRSAMLLVSLRRGPEGQETAVPARVLAKASDLRGRAQLVDMRKLRSEGGLLDYVGTVEIDAPDTLRFDVQVTRGDGATSSMQFTREFHPR
ncbi:MAG: DUF4426 domain-containing protein [Pseudomonadota bacterium]